MNAPQINSLIVKFLYSYLNKGLSQQRDSPLLI